MCSLRCVGHVDEEVEHDKYVCTEYYTAIGNMPGAGSVTRRLHSHS